MSKKNSDDNEKINSSVDIYNENDIRGVTAFISKNLLKQILFVCGVIVIGIPVYEVLVGAFKPSIQRPIHLLFMYTITFIVYPSGFFKNKKTETIVNILLITLLIVLSVWSYLRWTPLYINPTPYKYEVIFAFLFIFMTFEATRRAIGSAMSIIAAVFIAYCFVGPYLPRLFAHPGFAPSDLVTHLVIGTEGMMGDLMAIGATQIVFFMLFAAFLKMSNATTLFMDFSKAIAGHSIGGPAKVAVVSSCIMGMVSGSASGNTATTGSVTIPLMISMGFKRHVAAAIEAVSSTAGQFMPPIMGAAAFVIAEYTGSTYWDVCVAAFIPSLVYFIGMFFVVETQSRKRGIRGLTKTELPPLKQSILNIIPLIIPLSALVVLLALRYSPQYSIIISIIVLIAVSLPFKMFKINIKMILKALALTSKIMIPITTSCASCGLIVGVMSLTGFGERLAYGILNVANGNLLIGLVFTAVMCIIIGMGLPTLAAYVVLATLGVPALTQLGAPLLASHLFVFYCAIISAITPPVCLSAFVGAGIAGANPLKVGFTSMGLAPFIYFIPFMFVFNNGLLFQGSMINVLMDFIELLLFIFPLIVLSRFYWLCKVNVFETIIFLCAIVSLFIFKDLSIVFMLAFNLVGAISHLMRSSKIKKYEVIKV